MDFEFSPLCVRRAAQKAVRCLRLLVERVVLILRPDAGDLTGRNETGNVVDVSVRFVGVDAVLDPQYLFAAEIVEQHFFDLFFRFVRVAPRGEQAHLRRQHRSFAVNMDRAALEHEIFRAVAVHARDLADLARDLVVLVPGKVKPVHKPAPGVERPVHRAKAAPVVHKESRPAVAHPRIVALKLHHADIFRQAGARVLILAHRRADGDLLKAANGLCDLGKSALRGLSAVAPVVAALGPEHPNALLRFKFSGHAIPVLLRRCADNSSCHTFISL